MADTDPDLPAAAPGTMLLDSLPAVADRLASLVQHYHAGAALTGLESNLLRHRLCSLRPTLTRRHKRGAGYNATWRVKYSATGDLSAARALEYVARVDVERILA